MGKGRNSTLVRKRDIRIRERYKFWSDEKKFRFDECLRRLSEEFFLSEKRIMEIIRDRDGEE
jgi:hypothetical protein